MTEHNPYSAPATTVRPPATAPLRWRLFVQVLVALQIILAALSIPQTLDLVRHGDISPLTAIAAALATLSLAVGGVLSAKTHVALYFFGTTMLLGALVLLQWRPGVAFTGFVVTLVACAMSVYLSKPSAKA